MRLKVTLGEEHGVQCADVVQGVVFKKVHPRYYLVDGHWITRDGKEVGLRLWASLTIHRARLRRLQSVINRKESLHKSLGIEE